MRSFITCLATVILPSLAVMGKPPEAMGDSVKETHKFCVCIDPGHPSEKNDGMTMTNGLREVSVNWQVALLLRKELEQDDITVVMTKNSEEEFVSNENRAAIANEKRADLFLRLHADAGNSTGFTVYCPRKEGSVAGVRGPSPEVMQRSAVAATLFHRSFADALRNKLQDNGIHGDEETFIGGRQGALTGSIFSKVPTVLVEMVFLTNPTDAAWIKQESNRVAMAKALAMGVRAVRDGDKDK